MVRDVRIIAFLVILGSVAAEKHKCPANSTFFESTTVCPKTCENYLTGGVSCLALSAGCACNDGYVLNQTKGHCILKSDCDPQIVKCPANSTYSKCASVCPKTCENYLLNQVTCMACSAGCACNDGYILNESKGHCIRKVDCDPEKVKCPKNNYYRKCGITCAPRTCDNMYSKRRFCYTLRCGPPGCFCDNGYIWNKDKICVPYSECGPYNCTKDDVHSIFKTCQSSSCVRTCDNYNQTILPCTKDCRTGCFCKDGYVETRTFFGAQCVKPDQCPHQCPVNESYQECGTACPITCANLKNPPKYCTYNCVSGCFCNAGFYRNGNKLCVPKDKC